MRYYIPYYSKYLCIQSGELFFKKLQKTGNKSLFYLT